MLVAGIVYLVWWFVVEAVLPGSYNPALGRLVVVGAFFLSLAASFVSPAVRRQLGPVFSLCTWLLTAHYCTYCAMAAICPGPWGLCRRRRGERLSPLSPRATCLFRPHSRWGRGLRPLEPALLRTIFLPGLVTMVTMRA